MAQNLLLTRRALGLGLLASALPWSVAWASAPGRYRYAVVHSDHGELGWHEVTVANEGAATRVSFRRELQVGALITLFYESASGEELWRDGVLQSFVGHTDRDGDVSDVAVTLQGDHYSIEATAGAGQAPATAFLAHAWNEALTNATILIEAASGAVKQVSTRLLGIEELTLASGTYKARHYHTDGEITRDLWYAEDGTWLKQETPRDGATVAFVLVERR